MRRSTQKGIWLALCCAALACGVGAPAAREGEVRLALSAADGCQVPFGLEGVQITLTIQGTTLVSAELVLSDLLNSCQNGDAGLLFAKVPVGTYAWTAVGLDSNSNPVTLPASGTVTVLGGSPTVLTIQLHPKTGQVETVVDIACCNDSAYSGTGADSCNSVTTSAECATSVGGSGASCNWDCAPCCQPTGTSGSCGNIFTSGTCGSTPGCTWKC